MTRYFAVLVALLIVPVAAAQPPLFTTSLPKQEFAARRAKVLQRIGDGVAVIQGAAETSSYEKFRQSNQCYYLTGVETPRAILVIDGRAKSSRLYLMPTNPQMERSEAAARSRRAGEELTGIDHVLPRDEFAKLVPSLADRIVYTTFRGETAGAGTPDREASHALARLADPWDQQASREEWFMSRVREKAAGITETGYENMSAFVPVEPDAIVKLMAEPGIAQAMRKALSTSMSR